MHPIHIEASEALRVGRYILGAFIGALFLKIRNSRKISITVRDRVTIDAYGYVISYSQYIPRGIYYCGFILLHKQAWASMCYSFDCNGQCEKPLIIGRVIIRTPALSLFHYCLVRVSLGIYKY